jgi:hypothetical protein
MRLARYLVTAAAAAGILAVVAAAWAETATLELKRLSSPSQPGVYSPSDYIYLETYPQMFFFTLEPQGKKAAQPANADQTTAFKRLVKKEPKYACDHPLRGVIKLGSQEFAFVLDAVATPASKDGKADADKAKSPSKGSKTDSAVDKLKEKPAKATAPRVAAPYNRLHLDFKHTGDLTDHEVVKADAAQPVDIGDANCSYWQIEFPRIDVTLDVDGTKLDYSFFFNGMMYLSPANSYTSFRLNSAVYREGDITLEGKKHHLVLLDFNSNGRFDDETKITKIKTMIGGKPAEEIYPQQGDMLLVDLSPSNRGLDSPYDITMGSNRRYVSKLVDIDGCFYDLKVSPAGDKITLTRSTAPLGSVSNPNDGFRALIYGEQGLLSIRGNKGTPVPVPAGKWKLLSYTIDRTEAPKPNEPAEKKDGEQAGEKDSPVQALATKLIAMLRSARQARMAARPRYSLVSARAGADYKAVEVRKGETVQLPFGPPYKPVVTADYYADGNKQLSLGMSLVGSAGEVCTNLVTEGGRPPTPEFTITDAKGKAVQEGSFAYG